MRSFHIVSICALLATIHAGSTSGLPPTRLTRGVGDEFSVVVASFNRVQSCTLEAPNNRIISFIPDDNSNKDKFRFVGEDTDLITPCRAIVRVEENDAGLWTIRAVTVDGNQISQSYQLIVTTAVTTTSAPSEEDDKIEVKYLPEEHFDTQMGETHDITIPTTYFVERESCLIVGPDGVERNLQNANISAVEIITDPTIDCGIRVTVSSEDVIGSWILISRGEAYDAPIEKRLAFTINVEEKVNAMPSEVRIVQGNDFLVRLEQPSPNPETCHLLGPDGNVYGYYEMDMRYINECGYIIRNINPNHSGEWKIVYGNRIKYAASINVSVITNDEQNQEEPLAFTWTIDQPVSEIFGPKNAVYCKVLHPKKFVVFEDFGRCNITLPRATSDHDGIWTMIVGLEGRVLTEETQFFVSIGNASPKERVVTNVVGDKPIVTLSCTVTSSYPIRACKFRTPSGRILLASPGVGEDRYTFHGQGSIYESGVHTHDCGIQITNPLARDLGIWRCGVETTNETYFGFLPVLCPWLMRDPEIAAAVESEPTLRPARDVTKAIAGDNVVLSCSVQSAIRYCYFRNRNGTVFNVGPGGSSSDMAVYEGSGLDAGECGIRFRSLRVEDSGLWTCHVGFEDHKQEQRSNLFVDVNDIMTVTHTVEADQLVVKGETDGRPLEYCRFVRNDGLGFTDTEIPPPYLGIIRLQRGECTIWMHRPTSLDRRPWTVVLKIEGQNGEIARTTAPIVTCPERVYFGLSPLWIIFLVVGLAMIMSAALMGPKKNRRWAYESASSIRQSFRKSFAKKAVNEQNATERSTANAA